VQKLLHNALDLLLPQRCVSCRAFGENLCASCIKGFTDLPALRCPLCNAAIVKPFTLCRQCRITYPKLRGIVAVGSYAGPLRQAIHHLKYQGRTSLAQDLSALLSDFLLEADIPQCAAVVPVPLHSKREAARGFNQSTLLAHAVGANLYIPVSKDELTRTIDTPPQVGLSRAQRLRNVAGAFATNPGAFSSGGVLLIDDVATTGATLVTCAKQLTQEGGAPWVWGAVLARG
jgi:ComF family protein